MTDSIVFCVLTFSGVSPLAVTVAIGGRATVVLFSGAAVASDTAQSNRPSQHFSVLGAVCAFTEALAGAAADAATGAVLEAGGVASAAQLKRPNQHLRVAAGA